MNGAEALVRSLIANGIDTCFANPGTSEMHFVAALDRLPGIRCVLGLQENVVTGMADGFHRVADRPATSLLHCGPGLSNGLANLHNARRAQSGIVNIVGDHATHHRPLDTPLTSDIHALAATASSWMRTCATAGDVGRDAAEAVRHASQKPGRISTLILPADCSWGEGGEAADGVALVPAAPEIDPQAIRSAASLLREGGQTLILLGGSGVSIEAQVSADRIAAATGARLMASSLVARIPRGRGRLALPKVPYSVDLAVETLSRFKRIVLVNCPPPASFFAYPGKPSLLAPAEAEILVMSRPDQDGCTALRLLAEALGVSGNAPAVHMSEERSALPVATGAFTPAGLAQTVAALLPENAIVVDEALTYGGGFPATMPFAAPHDWLTITGGAIGGGLPVATGAAIAAGRSRRVVNLQADGSAAFTVQALWTQAREALPCTTLLLNNRSYNILLGEYGNVGATPGQTAMDMLDLSRPEINWAGLAMSLGVEAARAETLEDCADLMRASFSKNGPFLIDLRL